MDGVKTWVFRKRLSDTREKVRNVAALVYLEDLEAEGKTYYDLCGFLDSLHIQAVLSPIHDHDEFTREDVMEWCERHYDEKTGDLDERYIDSAPYVGKQKKPHCHLGIMLTAQKEAQDFSEMMKPCVDIRPTMWEKMIDKRGFVRYCAHLDSPQKYRYSAMQVIGFGGVDLSCLLKEDDHEKVVNVTTLAKVAKDKGLSSFHSLADFCFESGDIEYINTMISRASFFGYYFGSRINERRVRAMERAKDK